MKSMKLPIEKELSPEDVLNIIYEVGQNKDIIIIKNDGLREDARFSAIIIYSKDSQISFRKDSDSLSDAVKNVVNDYHSWLEKNTAH